MPEDIARIVAIVLAAIFGWAAIAKVLRPKDWTTALAGYGLDVRVKMTAAVLVPAAEAAAAILLITAHAIGAAFALALVAGFSLAVLRARSVRGSRLPCGCFGASKVRDYRELLARNAVLGALAGVVLVSQRLESLELATPGIGDILPVALAAGGLIVALWAARQVMVSLRRKG
jgi:hypothetical protein